jgi:hypothetical protein
MKKNKKYLEAAELLIRNNEEHGLRTGCCFVLSYLDQCASNFHAIFKPEGARSDYYYFGPGWTEENILDRSLALLFMYEMGEL